MTQDLAALVRKHRTAILRVAENHGVTSVRLYGSVARGDAREGSDIDFLVEFEAGRNLFDLIGFKQELEELLGTRIDAATPKGLHPLIRDAVLSEAVPV